MKKLALILIPLTLIFFGCTEAEKTNTPGDDYPQAPEFTLTDLNGNEISLSDYSGKVIFLNFWATWCGPCKKEIADFIEAYKQYKDRGMVIIGISVDRVSPKSVQKFVEDYKINYPVAMYTSKIIKDYKPGRAIPTTIIIGPNGKIRHKKVGLMTKKILDHYFLKFIEKK